MTDIFVISGSLTPLVLQFRSDIPWYYIASFITLLIFAYEIIRLKNRKWHIEEVTIPLFKGGSVKIKPNYEVEQLAHKAWVEIQTRKVALPFDEKNDLIEEIYSSWYSLFKEIRELLKNVPANKVKNDKNTQALVNTMMSLLNDGLRPHLTKWQGRYRDWLKTQSCSRHEVQEKFPQYDTLISELKTLNEKLIVYTEALKNIAHNKS